MKTYYGTLTKQNSIVKTEGKFIPYPAPFIGGFSQGGFEDGYKVEGIFAKLPIIGESFRMTPTSGEFKHGFFRTSVVEAIESNDGKTVGFKTLNSNYTLKFELAQP